MDMEWKRGEYLISTDKARLDAPVVHRFLSSSYWAEGIPLSTVERCLQNSLVFGLYKGGDQVGLARVVTDYVALAYIADVFVEEAHRGNGLGRWLVDVITEHADLQNIRRWILITRDAHGLYEQVGFAPLARPESYMERHFPNLYRVEGDYRA